MLAEVVKGKWSGNELGSGMLGATFEEAENVDSESYIY
jgi:hypothetical protein